MYEIIFLLIISVLIFLLIFQHRDKILLQINPNTRKVYFTDSEKFEIVELDKNKNFKRGNKYYLYDKNLVKYGIALFDSDKAINLPLDENTPSSQEHTTFVSEKIFERLMLALHGQPIQEIRLIVLGILLLLLLDSVKIWGLIK